MDVSLNIKSALYISVFKFLLLIVILLSATCHDLIAVKSQTDSVKSISQVLKDQNKDGEPDLLGNQITVTGRATVEDSIYQKQYLVVYLQDSSAGIRIFSDRKIGKVHKGDSLRVSGTFKLYYGKPEIVADSLHVIDTASHVPDPIKINNINNHPEQYIGMLVEGEALVTGKDIGDEYTNLRIAPSDINHSLTIYIPNEHPYKKQFDLDLITVGDHIQIRGILDSYTFQNSGNTVYEILPRTPEDLQFAGLPRRYINILLGGGGFILILIIGWVIALKKQVRSKTEHLSQALDDKETLMQEIHHRVKNNLATVAGLLDLQIDTTDLDEVKSNLQDSKSRIQSMALIHDKLYQTHSYRSVRLDNYLKELAHTIHGAFLENHSDVKLRFSLESVELSVDKTVTCGLLLNELLVNAFKHAFSQVEQGILDIKLYNEKSQVVLIVADNGPGLPDNDQIKNQSLGYMLIETFVAQLNAEMEVNNNDGAKYTFRLPLD